MFSNKISALEEKISTLVGNNSRAGSVISPSTLSTELPIETSPVAGTSTQIHEGGVSRELVGIVNALRNGGAEKPRYPGKNSIHPVTFIEDLTSYLRKVYAAPDDLDIIIECLDGEVRNWARINKQQWLGLEDFKRDFLNTYWGETEQSKRIVQYTWTQGENPSMLSHFISLVGQAKMLTYTIPEQQLVNDIMCHFPKSVQYAWATNNFQTIIEATEFLRRLDCINGHEYHAIKDQTKRSLNYTTKSIKNSTWKNKNPYQRTRELEPKELSTAVISVDDVNTIETVSENLN